MFPVFLSYIGFSKLRWRTWEGCIFGEVGVKGRSHYVHRHLPVLETLQKTNCVKWGKDAGAHSPVVHSPLSPPTRHTYINTCARTHTMPPRSLPLICWPEAGGGGAARRISSFTVIIQSFLCREIDWGKGLKLEKRSERRAPQRAAGIKQYGVPFS